MTVKTKKKIQDSVMVSTLLAVVFLAFCYPVVI